MANLRSRASSQSRLVTERFDARAWRWDELYERTDLFSVIHRDRHARALRWSALAGLPAGAPALEIGPGAGLMATALAQRGFRVTAAEMAPEMIKIARARAMQAGVAHNVALVRADGASLPCASGTFSLVVALGVVPWLHRADIAIAELARVLRPGGYLIVTTDNRYRLNLVLDPRHHPALDPARVAAKSALRALGVWRPFAAEPRFTAHRMSDFDKILVRAGFEVVRRCTFGFGPFTLLGLPAVPEHLGVPLSTRLQRLADGAVPVIKSGGNQYLVLARRRGLS
jgi:ubiquinone/menaquinone biosynthesis C-methylase UbiE